MSTKSNYLANYSDVKEVLDAALAAGGGTYDLGDYNKAVHWRHRAYKFRKLFREQFSGHCPYDAIMLSRLERGDTAVTIRMRVAEGTFTPAHQRKATLTPAVDDDELLQAALSIADDL